ncbi:MAG: hypothetical protein HY594_03620 [Candidatus Omnitrophica bacterium]|nr:hypothetical protein [Candidatus Omnitrophota bacterium]
MASSNKGLTIVLVFVSVIATFAAVTFYMGRSSEQAKRIFAETRLEEELRLKAALEKERDDLTQAKTELEARAQELDGKVATLSEQAQQLEGQIAEEKRNSTTAREELATVRKQAEDARNRLEAERRNAADELAKTKQDTRRLQDELKSLREAKEALERRVKEVMSGEDSLDTIVVTPGAAPLIPVNPGAATNFPAAQATAPSRAVTSVAGSSTGKVLVVNREFNFIVVNFGDRDGMRAGQILEVVRGGKPIAKVQVERVYENMSAANIMPENAKADIKEGDQVRR